MTCAPDTVARDDRGGAPGPPGDRSAHRTAAFGDRAATVRVLLPEIAHALGGTGYVTAMLAVVVLLPIVIMLAAVLLERFEARTTRVVPPRTSRADLRLPPSRPAPAPPAGPRLALVPGDDDAPARTGTGPTGTSTGTGTGTGTGNPAAGLGADPGAGLRPAS